MNFENHVELRPSMQHLPETSGLVAECRDLEHATLRADQMASIVLGQAVDSSPGFSQTSNRCDTGKVTVWKPFEDIKVESILSPVGNEPILRCNMIVFLSKLRFRHAIQ